MYLTFEAHGTPGTSDSEHKIDLHDLVSLPDSVVDEGTAYGALVGKLAKWASERNVKLADTYPLYIYDGEVWDESCERIDAGKDEPGWIRKVAKFAWFVYQGNHYLEYDQILAYVNAIGWDWIDFDNLEDEIGEDYHGEFDGDHAYFAQEWHDGMGERIPSYLEHHIDWESFGESLVNDYAQYEWNDRTFLYHQ